MHANIKVKDKMQTQNEVSDRVTIISRRLEDPFNMSDDEGYVGPISKPLTDLIDELAQAAQHAQDIARFTEQGNELAAYSHRNIEELIDGVRKTKTLLEEEELIFKGKADLSGRDEADLKALLATVRESSANLAITIAQDDGWSTGLGVPHDKANTMFVLKNLGCFFSQTINKHLYDLSSLLSAHISAKKALSSPAYVHGLSMRRSMTQALEVKLEDHSVDKKEPLYKHIEALAKQTKAFSEALEKLGSVKKAEAEQRDNKTAAANRLEDEATTLVPLLRNHALRFGLAKVQKEEGEGFNLSSYISIIYSAFEHAEVQTVHLEVEEARDAILEELVERRIEKKRARLA